MLASTGSNPERRRALNTHRREATARARMAETSEPYNVARHRLLAEAEAEREAERTRP